MHIIIMEWKAAARAMVLACVVSCGSVAALRHSATSVGAVASPTTRSGVHGRRAVVALPLILGAARGAGATSVVKTEAEWQALLGPEGYAVLRLGATEAPYSSPLARASSPGTYVCAGCRRPLFSSRSKFESRTGWPCFGDVEKGAIDVEKVGFLEGVTGAAFRCADCGGRVGERFTDGAAYPGTAAMRTGLCLCYTSPSPRDVEEDGVPSSA